MEPGTALYLLAKSLILPPANLLIVAAVGIALMRRWPTGARWILVVTWLAFYALSTPFIASALQFAASGGTSTPVDAERLKTAQAIVVLGGGLRIDAPEYGGDTLGRLTLERTRYGARLARQTGLPVMVVGGRPAHAKRSESEVMRDALEKEFGVPVRWVESKSRDTHENARNAATILIPLEIRRIALVMHGFDVHRAATEFQDAGFEVIPAPTMIPDVGVETVADVLPQAGALLGSYYAIYELIGFFVQQVR